MKTQNQKFSAAQESYVTRRLKSIFGNESVSMQPGSGNQAFRGNDVFVANELYVECKETINASIPVKFSWLHDMRKKAFHKALPTALHIQFTLHKARYVMIDEDYFYHLLTCEQEARKVQQGGSEV